MAACGSSASSGPTTNTPSPALSVTSVGDIATVNVNGTDPCSNAIYHAARVVAVGTHAIILNDTLNPRNGFSSADFQRYAARFDSLVYPLDVQNFGEPTDIDKNGHIGIIFTRAVNELTPARSPQYTGGFTFSRDLFPIVGTARAQACAGSNQGEMFYLLTPDPTGAINSNVRTTGFVDSATTVVLAHEFQHLINASRRLYVNNAPAFEVKWLDEGLAHLAEELLFYREGGLGPRQNLDVTLLRVTQASRAAFNVDMSGNASRYKTYLVAPSTASPYSPDDSLSMRGASWSLLRYSLDRINATDGFTAGAGQSVAGSGSLALTPGANGGEYLATLVNTTLQSGGSMTYTLQAGITGASSTLATAHPVRARVAAPAGDPGALQPDFQFEDRLRARERTVLTPMMGVAREWYASQGFRAPASRRSRALLSNSSASDVADAAVLNKLVNTTATGFANLQSVVGNDLAGYVRDWSVSHAVDDIAALNTQYQQRSWNWHSIYSNGAFTGGIYPLQVVTLPTSATVSDAVVAGGSAFYRIVVPSGATVTLSLNTPTSAQSPNLQLVVVQTK